MPPSSRICSSNTPRSYSSVTLWPLSNARAVSPHGPLPRTSECRRCRKPGGLLPEPSTRVRTDYAEVLAVDAGSKVTSVAACQKRETTAFVMSSLV